MSDFLLQLSANPQARRLVKQLGLPVPMPQNLRRAKDPYAERPLEGQTLLVAGALKGPVGKSIARALVEAGAAPHVVGDSEVFAKPAEAWGRPVEHVGPTPAEGELTQVDAIVFDASNLGSPSELRALYDFFHPWISRLGRCGRVVVIGRPPQTAGGAAAAASRQALEGFTRSLAKELGRRGSTANLVRVDKGAENRLDPVLRFLLSHRSAFITAQPFSVTKQATSPSDAPRVRPLVGKTALVTGAARGIGAATAALLAQEGAKVICLDRPDDDGPLSKVARDIGGEVLAADITAEDAPKRIGDVLAEHGGADVIIHNAGVTRDKTLAKMRDDQWDLTLNVNLSAIVRCNEALLKRELLNKEGRIVCLSSVAGIAGNVGQTNYAASKAGVVGYVRHLADEVAKRGITVNAVAPGFIETRLTARMPVGIREAARRLSALGQGGQPADVGQALLFLSTPGSVGITGSVVRVCGGALVGS